MFPYACSLTDSPQLIHKSLDHKGFKGINGGQKGEWWIVNGEWWMKGLENEKCFTCLQDKSTTLKLIPMLNPKQLLFSSNLLLKIIQVNKITLFLWYFFFLFLFHIFFFLRNFIPSFYFWIFFFSFFEQIQQNKYTPTLAFWYNTKQIKTRSIRTQEVTIIVLQT